MKTSFYFVVWMVIYPILGLFHNSFIDNNSFIVALAAVLGLSWWLNKTMPKTHEYESYSQLVPIMENIYTGNLPTFLKRLTVETRVEGLVALYFLVSTAATACIIFKTGMNEWFTLVIFGFFAFVTISSALKYRRALSKVRANLTAEQ